MTSTTPAAGANVLASLVDALLAEPLDELDATSLQTLITALTPQVGRLQGWLQTAAGQLAHLTGGALPAQDDGGRVRSLAGWLADVQHSTAGAAGAQLRTARLLRGLPLVTAAVLDGVLTPAQAAVLTRLVGTIEVLHAPIDRLAGRPPLAGADLLIAQHDGQLVEQRLVAASASASPAACTSALLRPASASASCGLSSAAGPLR